MCNDRNDHSIFVDTLVETDKWRNWGGDEQSSQHALSVLVISGGTGGHKQLETQAQHQTTVLNICAAHYSSQTDIIIWATQQPNQLSRACIYYFQSSGKEIGLEVSSLPPDYRAETLVF